MTAAPATGPAPTATGLALIPKPVVVSDRRLEA